MLKDWLRDFCFAVKKIGDYQHSQIQEGIRRYGEIKEEKEE